MAVTNPFTGGSAALSDVPVELQPQLQQANRQQQMANLLLQQGMSGAPQGQMVSGRYVAPSWSQQLAPIANQALALYAGYQADKAQTDLAAALRGKQEEDIAKFGELLKTNPSEAYSFASKSYVPQLREAGLKKMMPEEITLSEGQKRFMTMPDGTIKEIASGGQKLPATLDVAVSLIPNLPRDSSKWTDAQVKQVENKVLQLEAAKASVTHVNLPSEGERKAGFMSNILDRNILQMQNALGIDPKAVKPNVPASIVEAVTGPNLLSRSMTPEQRQIVEDSQLDVLDAALTLRTGAAYTPVQLSAMRATYFPVLGDKPAAIKAKKQRLETLLEGAYIAAGRATPARVSAPPQIVPPAPNVNKELNIPSVNKPKFLGFEQAPTGQQ